MVRPIRTPVSMFGGGSTHIAESEERAGVQRRHGAAGQGGHPRRTRSGAPARVPSVGLYERKVGDGLCNEALHNRRVGERHRASLSHRVVRRPRRRGQRACRPATPRRRGPPAEAQMDDRMDNIGHDLSRIALDQDFRAPPGGLEPPTHGLGNRSGGCRRVSSGRVWPAQLGFSSRLGTSGTTDSRALDGQSDGQLGPHAGVTDLYGMPPNLAAPRARCDPRGRRSGSSWLGFGCSAGVCGALAFGVPLLVLPQGADQYANAERVSLRGAGRQLLRDDLSVDAVCHSLRAVLDDANYRRCAERIQTEIHEMPHARDAVTRIEALTKG